MEGRTIADRYRLEELVGQGSMGSVWRAEHTALGSPVAVKLIDADAARNPEAVGRFQREAQIAARIRSAHVVRMVDHGYDQGLPFIVMEWLDGQSLRELLDQRGRLSVEETARVVTQICRALTQAHELGLVHRDVKPENVFAVPGEDGSGDVYKVLDFGVAKVTDSLSVRQIGPTKTGALLGTPYYVSPEQARGLKTLDHRADLWSVGVLCYECLTGRRPFEGAALPPLLAQIVEGEILPPTEASPEAELPAELDGWMAQALSREPQDRFATAKVLATTYRIAAGLEDTPSEAGRAVDPDDEMEAPTEQMQLPPARKTSPGIGPADEAPTLRDEGEQTPELVAAARAVGAAAAVVPPPAPSAEDGMSLADTHQMRRSPAADAYETGGAAAAPQHPAQQSTGGPRGSFSSVGLDSGLWPGTVPARTGPSPYVGVVVAVVGLVALLGAGALLLAYLATGDGDEPSSAPAADTAAETTTPAAEAEPSSEAVSEEIEPDEGSGGSADDSGDDGQDDEEPEPTPSEPEPSAEPRAAKPKPTAKATAEPDDAPTPKPTATAKAPATAKPPSDWSHRKTLD